MKHAVKEENPIRKKAQEMRMKRIGLESDSNENYVFLASLCEAVLKQQTSREMGGVYQVQNSRYTKLT